MTDQIVRTLLSQGILGIISALFIGLYLKAQIDHREERNQYTSDLKAILEKASKDLQDLATKHAFQLKELNEHQEELRAAHAEELRELLEQINDLREAHAQRERACLQTVEYFAKQEVEAVEELARIAEMIRRVYEASSRR